jgi:hypothetical protein
MQQLHKIYTKIHHNRAQWEEKEAYLGELGSCECFTLEAVKAVVTRVVGVGTENPSLMAFNSCHSCKYAVKMHWKYSIQHHGYQMQLQNSFLTQTS